MRKVISVTRELDLFLKLSYFFLDTIIVLCISVFLYTTLLIINGIYHGGKENKEADLLRFFDISFRI